MATIHQVTTKERAPYSDWLFAYATNNYSKDMIERQLYLRRMIKEVKNYQRAIKREPIARQTEIVFPLNLKP